MRVGLATVQRGRPTHLALQGRGVRAQTVAADTWVVVSMDPDPLTSSSTVPSGPTPGEPRVVRMPVPDGDPLPLSAARNAAIAALGDVDLAIMLDVDCVPGPELISRYVAASRHRDALLAGPVGHLPPGVPRGSRLTAADVRRAEVRGGRPVPRPGELADEPRYERFWSLSFAVRPETHARIGGFDEAYTGYGGEDTDYALRTRRAEVPFSWVGGAWAYHLHHPVSAPPREHLTDIVRNARVFRQRWGRWAMEGWLRTFAAEGLVSWDPDGDRLELVTSSDRRP